MRLFLNKTFEDVTTKKLPYRKAEHLLEEEFEESYFSKSNLHRLNKADQLYVVKRPCGFVITTRTDNINISFTEKEENLLVQIIEKEIEKHNFFSAHFIQQSAHGSAHGLAESILRSCNSNQRKN